MTYEDFNYFLDLLFWEGYAEQYARNCPEEYSRELTEFLNLHSTTNGNKKSNHTREAAAA